ALPAELRLAAQRLLGDQAVGTDRARVDLVVHQMVQLHHVDVADRHAAIELLAGAPVMQRYLAGMVEAGQVQHLLDVAFLRPAEPRGGDRYAVTQVAPELDQLLLLERLDGLVLAIDLLQGFLEGPELLPGIVGVNRLPDALAEARTRPAEMRFQD